MGDSPGFLSARAALTTTPSFNLGTPSQLTPNTRSEAEAALSANSETQTDSAAPTTPLPDAAARFDASHALAGRGRGFMTAGIDGAGGGSFDAPGNTTLDEAQMAYRRPPHPVRTSSSNYAEALRAASGISPTSATSAASIASGVGAVEPSVGLGTVPPEAIVGTKGVVPLKTGIGEGQAEAVKKVRPGLSLGDLARQQSWSEQDFKHVYSERLMAKGEGDAGYSSAAEGMER